MFTVAAVTLRLTLPIFTTALIVVEPKLAPSLTLKAKTKTSPVISGSFPAGSLSGLHSAVPRPGSIDCSWPLISHLLSAFTHSKTVVS